MSLILKKLTILLLMMISITHPTRAELDGEHLTASAAAAAAARVAVKVDQVLQVQEVVEGAAAAMPALLVLGGGQNQTAANRTSAVMPAAAYYNYNNNGRNDSGVLTQLMDGGGGGGVWRVVEDGVVGGELLEPRFRGKRCMRNLTQCMDENIDYSITLDKLSSFLFTTAPPMDLTRIDGVSEECKIANRRYLRDLKMYKFWAMRMYDSTAKMPSGFLSGNINQLGDFDSCMRAKVDTENEQIYGKYCLAAVQVETPNNDYLAAIHNLVYAHNAFLSNLGDPGHRVPRFSSINWGVCMPNECSAKDLELGLRRTVDSIVAGTELNYKMEVDSHMCTSSKPVKYSKSFIIVSGFFLSVFLIALAATLYDHRSTNKNKNEWILSFSLKKNISSMIDIRRQPNDLEAVHGIRFMNAIMLLLAHKSMALLFLPYTNRTGMSEIIGQPWTVIGRAASLYTDPFIMLSATLTAYTLFGKLSRTGSDGRLPILTEYASRLFRILPTLGALILFCTFVLPSLGAGPLWNQVVTHHADICERNWWRNLMFIHNYFGFEEMCLTHTHHVGIDTQLFFLSPFMVLMIWKWPKRGTALLLAVAVISTIMRYYVTLTMKLSNYVHFGTSIQQLFNTADHMYILPAHRLTVYIMGIFLAYVLRNYKNIQLKPVQLYIGNILALISFLISFCGAAFMGDIDYVYNETHAAWYAAFAPILWCFSFAWVIFTRHTGHKGIVGEMFSLPIFKIWTKISYTVYLTQFPVFFYNVGTTKHSTYYYFIPKTINLLEMLCIFSISALLTLLFESPFQNIRNLIIKRKQQTVTSTTTTTTAIMPNDCKQKIS